MLKKYGKINSKYFLSIYIKIVISADIHDANEFLE